jgi:methyl-accepting chemotaxis protein
MMKNLRIAKRLGLMSALIAAVMLVVTGSVYWGLVRATNLTERIVSHQAALALTSLEIRSVNLLCRRYEKDWMLNAGNAERQASYFDKWEKSLRELTKLFELMNKLDLDVRSEEHMRKMWESLPQYERGFREVVTRMNADPKMTPTDGNKVMEGYKAAIREMEVSMDELAERYAGTMREQVDVIRDETRRIAIVTVAVAALAIAITVALSRSVAQSISQPIMRLADVTVRFSKGDLSPSVEVEDRRDEVGQLSASFAEMQRRMREMIKRLNDGVTTMSSNSAQIGATAKEYATTVSEQATSVAQVTTTIEEIKHTSRSVEALSEEVVAAAEQAVSGGLEGRQAITLAVAAMDAISERVSGIATKILGLSAQTNAIGLIVDTVKELAEQSNLLAVNASIEAAKAGEQGRGFSVVASEVRSLAEQSKRATQQIRGILAEIQKATQTVVMATEDGSKRVEDGVRLINSVNLLTEELSKALEQSAMKARQITGAASQQAVGVSQISTSMDAINRVGKETAKGITQLEQAVRELNRFSHELQQAGEQYRL